MGEERDINKKSIIEYAKKYKIDKKIFFIKKIDNECFFPIFSLGVLFSQTESSPNAIMEYLMLKLPVFAMKTGDVTKLVDNSNGKVFTSKDPSKISKELAKIILDKNLYSKSKKSYLKVNKYTNKSKTLFMYSNIIKKILCVE